MYKLPALETLTFSLDIGNVNSTPLSKSLTVGDMWFAVLFKTSQELELAEILDYKIILA